MKWHSPYEAPIEISGLPWAGENAPDLWRLPRAEMDRVPERVGLLARYAAGAAIRFATDSGEVRLRATAVSEATGQGVDVYVDSGFWHTVSVTDPSETEICCFDSCDSRRRELTLYLPRMQEVRITAIGIGREAKLYAPRDLSRPAPIVLYGSSIAQGAGAARAAMGYGAQLGRLMDLEVVNLGFGGAGKAEREVVELVSRIDACCVVLDLGKSYGLQAVDAYARMLDRLRAASPTVSLVCITPVFSTRELHDSEYVALSEHTRDVMRRAATARRRDGDAGVVLVEGLELLGQRDSDGYSGDGVHPNDLGYARIAERLQSVVAGALA